jgi:hypothetical protein
VRFKVITCERFLIESETVAFEFNAHAKEFSHNAEIFDIKGLQAGETIIRHVGARGCGEQIVNIDPEDGNIGIFVLIVEADDDFDNAGKSWTKDVCEMDSDKDGATNGEELGDPCCEWKVGGKPKRNTALSPAVKNSFSADDLANMKCNSNKTKTTAPPPYN